MHGIVVFRFRGPILYVFRCATREEALTVARALARCGRLGFDYKFVAVGPLSDAWNGKDIHRLFEGDAGTIFGGGAWDAWYDKLPDLIP